MKPIQDRIRESAALAALKLLVSIFASFGLWAMFVSLTKAESTTVLVIAGIIAWEFAWGLINGIISVVCAIHEEKPEEIVDDPIPTACSGCRFFDSHGVNEALGCEIGYCRAHAPAPGAVKYPKVTGAEWCGEFTARPASFVPPGTSETGEESQPTTKPLSPPTVS